MGSLAAVLNGAPVNTFDVDVVYSTDASNVERILGCLESLDATQITRGGHLNPITRLGALDLPGTIGEGLGYAELLPRSTEMEIGGGVRIRVLNLETIHCQACGEPSSSFSSARRFEPGFGIRAEEW